MDPSEPLTRPPSPLELKPGHLKVRGELDWAPLCLHLPSSNAGNSQASPFPCAETLQAARRSVGLSMLLKPAELCQGCLGNSPAGRSCGGRRAHCTLVICVHHSASCSTRSCRAESMSPGCRASWKMSYLLPLHLLGKAGCSCR